MANPSSSFQALHGTVSRRSPAAPPRRPSVFSPAGMQRRFGNQGAAALLGRLNEDRAAAPTIRRASAIAAPLPDRLQEHVRRGSSGGEPLPATVRADMEPRFGRDFSAVRIHRDAAAAESAEALGARAWTLGQHVSFGAGQWAPGRPAGDRLIAHELTHTVQAGGEPRDGPVRRQADAGAGGGEPGSGSDDGDAQYERELAVCRSLRDPGARARCYESAERRRWARENGRQQPPFINWRNVLVGVGAAIVIIGGIVLFPEVAIPVLVGAL